MDSGSKWGASHFMEEDLDKVLSMYTGKQQHNMYTVCVHIYYIRVHDYIQLDFTVCMYQYHSTNDHWSLALLM